MLKFLSHLSSCIYISETDGWTDIEPKPKLCFFVCLFIYACIYMIYSCSPWDSFVTLTATLKRSVDKSAMWQKLEKRQNCILNIGFEGCDDQGDFCCLTDNFFGEMYLKMYFHYQVNSKPDRYKVLSKFETFKLIVASDTIWRPYWIW